MRIVICTRPAWLDPTVPLACELGRENEVHLLIELAPEHGFNRLFDVTLPELRAGLTPALDALMANGGIPNGLQRDLRRLAGVHLLVHTSRRVYAPNAVMTGLQIARTVRSWQPDVLHLDDFTGRTLPLIYALPRVPVVVSLHDVQPHTGEPSRSLRAIRRLGLRRARAVILHSRHAARILVGDDDYRGVTTRSHVIPLGVYSMLQHWSSPQSAVDEKNTPNDPIVLFWGRLSPYKGLEVLLQAAPLVARRIPRVRFVVAGMPVSGYTPPPPPPLDNGGVFDMRLRYISNEETHTLFTSCTTVVLPYIEATQSGVVATALAFAKPVIASDVGGLSEVVADSGVGQMVPAQSIEALADALIAMLSDSARRASFTARARTLASEELSWPRLARQTRGVYEQVLWRGQAPITSGVRKSEV